MARPKCGTPIVLFAFFLLKSGGKKKPRTFMLLPPSQPQVVFSFRQAYLSQQSAFFLQRKRSAKQNKSCGFLFVFWRRNKMLAMWINLHQVAYLGGISTTFPTLLEMLTPSNLSILYIRYSHLIKTSACTRRTEQRRKIKARLENTFHDHKSLLTTCVTKSWPLSLSIHIYTYNLFSLYILIF